MTEREAYIAFNLLPDMGAVTVARLIAVHGSAVAAWEALPDKQDWEGKPPAWEREIERAEKMHVTLVTLQDEAYPVTLRDIASPPLVLYVVGNPMALTQPGVALVGTRRPTLYGSSTAERLALGLAHASKTVFSGLALGIDAAAHHGALLGKGMTVGVLGGALDKFYPKDNTKLAREIVDAGGAVVSEFPLGRAPDAQTFPQRNRVVSGLSQGVVAVEAPLKSGTLITCRLALEQGRVVMAVPGRIDCANARGCLHLVREGATLVTSVEDILEAVGPFGSVSTPMVRQVVPKPSEPQPKPPRELRRQVAPELVISGDEAKVLGVLDRVGQTIDAVARAVDLPAGTVSALLVQLRLKRRVRFLPGNRVCLA